MCARAASTGGIGERGGEERRGDGGSRMSRAREDADCGSASDVETDEGEQCESSAREKKSGALRESE